VFLIGAIPQVLTGWQWPFEDFEVLRNFGMYQDQYATPGVDLEGVGTVALIEAGELVFRGVESDRLRGVPAPLGSMVAVEHARGFRSLYTHLDPEIAAGLDYELERAITLGPPGISGYTEGGYLHLQIFDQQLRRRVNPAILLPRYFDTQSPTIEEIGLVVGGEIRPASAELELAPGEYALAVSAWDTGRAGDRMPRLAPYRFVLERDGEQLSEVVFDREHVRNGTQRLNGRMAAELVVAPFVFAIGSVELTEDPVRYTLAVADHHENVTVERFELAAAAAAPAQAPRGERRLGEGHGAGDELP